MAIDLPYTRSPRRLASLPASKPLNLENGDAMSFAKLRELLNKPQPADTPPERHIVMVIDDDTVMRESLTLLLEKDYQIVACSSARDGVENVHDGVCAVILDIKMSREDGFWACDQIRKKVPDLPIIFYSAYQDLKDPYAIINEHRPFGYVTKSDDSQQLLDMLAVAVQLQSMIISNRKLIENLQEASDGRG
jgi:CheY-like chemotaxis protein